MRKMSSRRKAVLIAGRGKEEMCEVRVLMWTLVPVRRKSNDGRSSVVCRRLKLI